MTKSTLSRSQVSIGDKRGRRVVVGGGISNRQPGDTIGLLIYTNIVHVHVGGKSAIVDIESRPVATNGKV
jgi:hypothetical protein